MVPKGVVPTVPTVPKVSASAAAGRYGETAPKLAGQTPASVGGQLPNAPTPTGDLKDRLLAEIKSAKSTFYNLVVAQAFRIDVSPSGINFVFQANQKNAKQQADDQRAWLQQVAEKLAGKPVPVTITLTEPATPAAPPAVVTPRASAEDVNAQAMANATVQAVLEIFPVEKTTVEEV